MKTGIEKTVIVFLISCFYLPCVLCNSTIKLIEPYKRNNLELNKIAKYNDKLDDLSDENLEISEINLENKLFETNILKEELSEIEKTKRERLKLTVIEELDKYENPTAEMILNIQLPTMSYSDQYKKIMKLNQSKYKGLPSFHLQARPRINWCKAIYIKNEKNYEKAKKLYSRMQTDLISILGGTGIGGAKSIYGVSSKENSNGFPIQYICEGIYMLETTYNGNGDCERIYLDLIGRFHGQWSQHFKLFRQKIRTLCVEIGYQPGLWDLSNDRAYSGISIFKSPSSTPRKPNKSIIVQFLRKRGGMCSQLNEESRQKALLLKSNIDSIPSLTYFSSKVVLSDYCEVAYSKYDVKQCVEGIVYILNIKTNSNFGSSKFVSIQKLLIDACKNAKFPIINNKITANNDDNPVD